MKEDPTVAISKICGSGTDCPPICSDRLMNCPTPADVRTQGHNLAVVIIQQWSLSTERTCVSKVNSGNAGQKKQVENTGNGINHKRSELRERRETSSEDKEDVPRVAMDIYIYTHVCLTR